VNKSEQHILIVDDEFEIRKIIQEILDDEGFSTATAASAEEARASIKKRTPDLVFLDIWMPEEDGISLLKEWTNEPSLDIPVVMISGHATIETAIEATKLGARNFIEKPISIEKLLNSAQEVLKQNETQDSVFVHLIKSTKVFSEVLDGFKKELEQESIFILLSEEGLEKAAWAQALYSSHYSDEGEFKLIRFDQPQLLENTEEFDIFNELYNKKNSMVFLDGIENLSTEDKTRLFTKLTKETKNNPTKVFISASSLEEADLIERNIKILSIPPLRDHLKEVPLILDDALKFFVDANDSNYRRLSLAAQSMLSKYQWPGNLRQLVDLIQALLSRQDKEIVNVDEIQEIIILQGPSGNILIENNILSLSMREAKKLFEKAYLSKQLELVDGKISELSRRVDMERTNLYRKLQSLDIKYKKKKPTS
jgi:DNA-binding NtrC family response regulator